MIQISYNGPHGGTKFETFPQPTEKKVVFLHELDSRPSFD